MSATIHSEPAGPAPSVIDALVVFVGAQLLSSIWVQGLLGALHPDGLPDPVPTGSQLVLNLGLWVGYGLGPLLIVARKGIPVGAALGIGLRRPDAPAGFVAGLVLQLVVIQALYLVIVRIVDGDPSESAKALVDAASTPVELALLTVAVVVIAPLVEELFFRGLLLGALRRRFGDRVAVVASSALFAAVHGQLLPLPGLFLFGVVAALVVVRTGRLGPVWFLHAGFNAATVVLLVAFA